MAFGRLERSRGAPPFSDINMTPLIDVMLVLLVIFIVTAPMMVSRLRLDLPDAGGTRPDDPVARVSLAIDAQGRLFVEESVVDRDALIQAVREAAARDPATEVQLRADRTVPYGQVAEAIGWVQQAGLTRIGLVTEAAAQ